MKVGAYVSTLVTVFSDPPVEKNARCKVLGMSGDKQKVFLQGPRGQVVSLPRGDVFTPRK